MSLLQNLPFQEYKKVQDFTREQCEVLAKLADLKISFMDTNPTKKPGEHLIKILDRYGYSLNQYNQLLAKASSVKTVLTYYKPQTKVAILVANEDYQHLSKLATPYVDCSSLAYHLKNLGFVVILLRDVSRSRLILTLNKIAALIPKDSYCFFFYAGHGCELLSVKCILTEDCPLKNINGNHFVTENVILNIFAARNLELSVFIMDMCRFTLDLNQNPEIMGVLKNIPPLDVHKNLLISYSAQSSQSAYEIIQLECSDTINSNLTYELKTGDTSKVTPGTSLYVNALITRIEENLDVSSLLDKVHEDVELGMKQQKPLKMQCGMAKHSLYDQAQGDTITVVTKLREISNDYNQDFTVY